MTSLYSDVWMNYLYKIKKLYQEQNIKIKDTNKKIAVIIEPRNDFKLELVFKNFVFFLFDDWNFAILYGNKNKDYVEKFTKNMGKIKLFNLKIDNLTLDKYNSLLKSDFFYNLFSEDFILIFQLDTLLFRKIDLKFLDYQYVGGPWKKIKIGQNLLVK